MSLLRFGERHQRRFLSKVVRDFAEETGLEKRPTRMMEQVCFLGGDQVKKPNRVGNKLLRRSSKNRFNPPRRYSCHQGDLSRKKITEDPEYIFSIFPRGCCYVTMYRVPQRRYFSFLLCISTAACGGAIQVRGYFSEANKKMFANVSTGAPKWQLE